MNIPEFLTTNYIYLGLSLSVAFSAFALALSMCQKSSILCTITKYMSAIISAVFLCNFFMVVVSPLEEPKPIPEEAFWVITLSFLLGVSLFKYFYREWQLRKETTLVKIPQ